LIRARRRLRTRDEKDRKPLDYQQSISPLKRGEGRQTSADQAITDFFTASEREQCPPPSYGFSDALTEAAAAGAIDRTYATFPSANGALAS
jgi:hypothetical protein